MTHLLYIPVAICLCAVTHELSHYITAYIFGKSLQFQFTWGKLFGLSIIPRWIWYMPNSFTRRQKIITGLAGFTGELLFAAVCFMLGYRLVLLAALTHLLAYNFYAGEANDFKWLRR